MRAFSVMAALASLWAVPAGACTYTFDFDPRPVQSAEIAERLREKAALPPECGRRISASCLVGVASVWAASGEPPRFQAPNVECADSRVAQYRHRAELLFLAGRGREARSLLERIPAGERVHADELSRRLIETLRLAGRGDDAAWVARTFRVRDAGPERPRGRAAGVSAETLARDLGERRAYSVVATLRRMAERGETAQMVALVEGAARSGARLNTSDLSEILRWPSRVSLTVEQAEALSRNIEIITPGLGLAPLYLKAYRIGVHGGNTELADWAAARLSLRERRFVDPDEGPLPRWSDIAALDRLEAVTAQAIAGVATADPEFERAAVSLLEEHLPYTWKLDWLQDVAVRMIAGGRGDLGLRLLAALPQREAAIEDLIVGLALDQADPSSL